MCPWTGKTTTPRAAAFQQARLLESIAAALDDLVLIPNDITLVPRECGFANAFCMPLNRSITYCYELIRYHGELFHRARAEHLVEDPLRFLPGGWHALSEHATGRARTRLTLAPDGSFVQEALWPDGAGSRLWVVYRAEWGRRSSSFSASICCGA